MRKQVVVINGSGGTGKDTFVHCCEKIVPCMNISSVDNVKEAARILGWNEAKDEKSRKFLSDLKFLSTNYNNQPYRYIEKTIDYFRREDSPYSLLFIHVREPEEIDKIKKDFGCITLKIKNPRVKEIKSNEADGRVNEYTYDYEINNDGSLEKLDTLAKGFIINILKEQNYL